MFIITYLELHGIKIEKIFQKYLTYFETYKIIVFIVELKHTLETNFTLLGKKIYIFISTESSKRQY